LIHSSIENFQSPADVGIRANTRSAEYSKATFINDFCFAYFGSFINKIQYHYFYLKIFVDEERQQRQKVEISATPANQQLQVWRAVRLG